MPIRLFIATLLGFSSLAFSQSREDELLRRIEELEKVQESLVLDSSQKTPRVNSFFRNNLMLGGFFEPTFTVLTGPDTKTQGTSGQHTLGINISSDVAPKTRFVAQMLSVLGVNLENPHNDPRATTVGQTKTREFNGAILLATVAQGYIEHSLGQNSVIQTGVGYLPLGYAFQQRETVLFVRRGGPQLIRTPEIISPLWTGVHLLGRVPSDALNMGYSAYTFTNFNDTKAPGVGGRAWFSTSNDRILTGLSTQVGKRFGDTYETLAYDLRWTPHFGILTFEIAKQFVNNADPWTAYVEPSFYLYQDELLLYTFADYVDSPQNITGPRSANLKDPYKKWEYGFGINWLPNAYVSYRIGLAFHDYVGSTAVVNKQNRDFTSLDFSAGVAF